MPDSAAPISERPVFLTYDLVSGGLMFAAAWVAVSLMREDMSQRVRDLLLRATFVGSLLALLRGVPALVWDVWTAAEPGLGLFADVWFVVAGTAGLLLWTAVRSAGLARATLSFFFFFFFFFFFSPPPPPPPFTSLLSQLLLADVDRSLVSLRQVAERVNELGRVQDGEVRAQQAQIEGEHLRVVRARLELAAAVVQGPHLQGDWQSLRTCSAGACTITRAR